MWLFALLLWNFSLCLLISDYQFLLLIPIITHASIIHECTHVHLVFIVRIYAHVGTCMCLCKSTVMVLCLCKCVLRTDWPWTYMSPLISLHLRFSERTFYWTWCLLNQLNWLATEFHGSFCLLDYTHDYLDRITMWYWTLRLRFSWLHNKYFTKWTIFKLWNAILNQVAWINN